MARFKDIKPGLFRAKNGMVYVKFRNPLVKDENTYNAAVLTSGECVLIEDDAEEETFE